MYGISRFTIYHFTSKKEPEMINGISSMSSAMVQRQPPPPPDKDAFKIGDSDSNGVVSETELETLLEGITETTGTTITTDEALSTYDADGDGGLNGEELFSLLSENGFLPPQEQNSEAGAPPPPPPPMEEALASYAENSGDDLLQQLMDYMQGDQSSEEEDSSINILS